MATSFLAFRKSALFLLLGLSLTPLTALGCVESWLADMSYSVTGEASSASGASLYTETLRHTPGPRGGILDVQYFDPDDNLIATKEVSYNCNPTTPSYELTDLQSNTRQGVRWNDDAVECYSGEDSATLAVPDTPSIVDAGFDNAVKLSWDALIAGDTVRYNYLFHRDKKFLKLRLVKAKAPKGLRNEADDNIVFFRIAANNVVLRLFAKSIYVGYEQETRLLRYYVGPSNLPTMADQKQVVIRYGQDA